MLTFENAFEFWNKTFCKNLYKFTKLKNEIKEQEFGNFVFVPLKGKHGFDDVKL